MLIATIVSCWLRLYVFTQIEMKYENTSCDQKVLRLKLYLPEFINWALKKETKNKMID